MGVYGCMLMSGATMQSGSTTMTYVCQDGYGRVRCMTVRCWVMYGCYDDDGVVSDATMMGLTVYV